MVHRPFCTSMFFYSLTRLFLNISQQNVLKVLLQIDNKKDSFILEIEMSHFNPSLIQKQSIARHESYYEY